MLRSPVRAAGSSSRIFPATPGANVSKRNGTFAAASANV